MDKCVLCSQEAKERKYFFNDQPLCHKDYASYLEYLLDDMKVDVTSNSANSAFGKLKIELKPEPRIIRDEKEVKKRQIPSPSFGMKM